MGWRIDQNETNFSDAKLLAWDYVLPYKHLPILDNDYKNVKKIKEFLEKSFSKQALSTAVKRLNLKDS